MRDPDWKSEIRDALRQENWSLTGSNRVVKVVPLDRAPQGSAGGYITLARFLLGLTPERIEKELGLPSGYLIAGARIYRFTRLPQPSEYTYELTTKYPDGLAYIPGRSDPRYPPGSDRKHQWRINDGVQIPVDGRSAIELAPRQTFTDIP